MLISETEDYPETEDGIHVVTTKAAIAWDLNANSTRKPQIYIKIPRGTWGEMVERALENGIAKAREKMDGMNSIGEKRGETR